jgi:hypothetical protein
MGEEPVGLSLSLDDIITKGRGEEGGGRFFPRRGRFFARGPDNHGMNADGNDGHGPHRTPRRPQQFNKDYRLAQSCFMNESGATVFKYHASELVTINSAGDITINTDGHHGATTLASLNDALNPIGISVKTAVKGELGGDWTLSDGKSLVRLTDGVVLPAKGPMHAGRGPLMLQAFQSQRWQRRSKGYGGGKSDRSDKDHSRPFFSQTEERPSMDSKHSVFQRLNDSRSRPRDQRYAPY